MEVNVMVGLMRRVALVAACLVFILLSVWDAAGAEGDLEGIEDLLGKDWYGLYLLGHKLGYATIEFGATEFGGENAYKLNFNMHIQVATLGVEQELDAAETRMYGADGGLRWLKVDMPQPMGQNMQFIGEVVDDKFRLTKKIAGQDQVVLIDVPEETLRDALKEAAMINEDTKVGDSFASRVYDPLLNEREAIEAKSVVTAVEETMYNGVPTRVFRVETTLVSLGTTAVSKVTPDGETIESRMMGITMRLETEDLAKDVKYVADTMISSAIMPATPVTEPRDVTKITVRVTGITDDRLIMKDARQAYLLEENESGEGEGAAGPASPPQVSYLLTVRKDDLDTFRHSTVPMREAQFGAALRPSTFVQSSDPKIVNLAKNIVGDEENSVEVMKKLNRWVYRTLEKEFTASVSNALDTLERRSGDCTEHSVLFVALARAAGLPAREVSGIVYSGEYGGFFFHQWAEVFVGKWVATDPTFDQPIADATHIKLTEGDLLQQVRISSVIGRLGIEVLDFAHE
jgi:hypothetical protein